METQKVLIPEVIYPQNQNRTYKTERNSKIRISGKTAALLTAAALSLAADAKTDTYVKSADRNSETIELFNGRLIIENKNPQESRRFLAGLGILAAIGLTMLMEKHGMDHDGGPDD